MIILSFILLKLLLSLNHILSPITTTTTTTVTTTTTTTTTPTTTAGIPQFHLIKLRILLLLSEEVFVGITGSTDSEYIFALILQVSGLYY